VPKFEVRYYHKAERELDSLDPEEARKIIDDIEGILTSNPFPEKKRKKKIHGVAYPLYRLRVATARDSYRVFYLIEKGQVIILRVVRKKEADRILRTLKKRPM